MLMVVMLNAINPGSKQYSSFPMLLNVKMFVCFCLFTVGHMSHGVMEIQSRPSEALRKGSWSAPHKVLYLEATQQETE